MKTTLLFLLLTSFAIWGQNSPPDTAPPTGNAGQDQPKPAPNPSLPAPKATPGTPADKAAPGAIPLPNFPRPLRPTAPGTTNLTTAPGNPAAGNPAAAPGNPPAAALAPGQLPPGIANPGEQLTAIAPPAPGAAGTQEKIIPAGMIKFPATDLNQVLTVYAELVGRTILRPTSLPAPAITLVTQTDLTRTEAIAAFDAVFALNGITVINFGDKFAKVVPSAQGGNVGGAINKQSADQLPDLGQFVTQVVQTKFVKPSELTTSLQPFASPGIANGILAIDPNMILVLRDYSENVKRMLEMIKQVDVSVPSEYISEVIPIKYALSSEIANALNSLSSGGGGTTVGGGAGGTGMSMGTRTGGYGGYGSRGYGSSGYGGYGSSYNRGYGGMNYGGGYSGGYGTTPYATITPGATAAPGTGGTFGDRLQRIINRAAGPQQDQIQVLGQTKIIADERTNSLLIFASRDDMKTIKDIVAKLDVVLAQVLIEAVIIEISLDDTRQLAISWLQKTPKGSDPRGIGAINNNNILGSSAFSPSSGGTNSLLPQGFSYLASFGGGDLDVTVTALAGNSKARILQRPRIQTSHAVPATLFVGEQRPYPSGSYYGGASFGSYAQIQQLQIGVSLEVTPLINPDGLVVMDIHQKIDSFKGNVTIQGVGDVPVTSSKDATAKVAVRDHDTIILGGLIENTKNSNNSGVPFLKDIPVLGPLFRSSSQDFSRSELVVLIRPTVLPTPEVAALTARAEQKKMPEVNRFESEINKAEAKRLRDSERDLKSNQ